MSVQLYLHVYLETGDNWPGTCDTRGLLRPDYASGLQHHQVSINTYTYSQMYSQIVALCTAVSLAHLGVGSSIDPIEIKSARCIKQVTIKYG